MQKKNNATLADQFMAGAARQQHDNTQQKTAANAARTAAERREEKAAAQEHARLQKAFAEYYRDLAPLMDALQTLPAKDGKEFFVRTDMHVQSGNAAKSLNIWIVYTQAVPNGQSPAPCDTHSLYMPRKNADADDAQDLYLSEHSMLRLSMTREDGKTRIESHRAYEAYDYAPGGRGHGLYRGDYRQVTGTSHEQPHKKLKDAVSAIGAWVNDCAPDRIPDIRAAMDARQSTQEASQLAHSVSVMRPATVRKRIQP